jgi:hypothetical protein
MKCHLLSYPIFFDEKWRTIVAMVSAISLQAGVAVGAVLPGALATLAGEIGTDLGKQILKEDICCVGVMFGKKEHDHVHDWALRGWVGSTIAAGLFLALGGGPFCTLA